MAKANTSLTVTFGTATGSGGTISIELDAASNVDVDGNTITTFPLFKGEAFILAYCDTAYTMDTNGDRLTKVNSRVPVDVVEDITFDKTNTKNLTRLPIGAVSYDWVGKAPSPSNLSFNGQEINSPSQDTLGVVKCTYKALADRWKLNYSRIAPSGDDILETDSILVVAAIDADTKASLSISFTEEDASTTLKSWGITVKDFCTDGVLDSVAIWVDGVYQGVTDSNGYLSLGRLTRGAHTLKMTRASYVDSDIDRLNNDSFNVP